MVTPADVKWGGYKSYEGPYFHGSRQFRQVKNPDINHLILEVVTSTEGGSPDAVNGYDRCIISVGYIQWCEAAYFLTSNLLGYIASKDPGLLAPLAPALAASKAEFKQKPGSNKWRFYFKNGNNEVDERAEQQRLFLLNSDGFKGSWDDESKAHTKLWVACFANTMIQDAADNLQVAYTAARIKTFTTKDARAILFDEKPDTGWVGALRAAFLSYAANNPAIAAAQLTTAVKATTAAKWSPDWCIAILKQLTFGPNITIYPGRYNKIRPVIEKNFGVDLPDFSDDLKKWHATQNQGIDAPTEKEPSFQTVEEIQTFLLSMGYDLGPAGADGKLRGKTKDAILIFQGLNGLKTDGIIGPKTRAKMLEVYRKKICA